MNRSVITASISVCIFLAAPFASAGITDYLTNPCGGSNNDPCAWVSCTDDSLAEAGAAGLNPSTSASIATQRSGYHTDTYSWATGTGHASASASISNGGQASCG